MRQWTVGELASRLFSTLHGVAAETPFTGFTTDSREEQSGKVFLAIRGENADGHDYAETVAHAGVAAVIAERPVAAPHVLVDNLVAALARFAGGLRDAFTGPVVGVTGSAGKTTTKEFIAAALSPLGPVLKNPGNRNSEYTSPLLWAELEDHKAVVTEMGMRGFGQIAHLASFVRPTIGVVTNIGYAHIEKVGSREGIFRAKTELLQALDPQTGISVVWREDDFYQRLKHGSPSVVRSYGFSAEADCRILSYQRKAGGGSMIAGVLDGQPFEAELPTVGRHNALNAGAALVVGVAAGVSIHEAAAALTYSQIPPLRMQTVAHGHATVLLDAYNASPPSVVYAIESLAEFTEATRCLAVLGEMKELGDASEEGHRMVGRALAASCVERVALFGEGTWAIQDEAIRCGMADEQFLLADDLDDLREFLDRTLPGDVVLLKGSRALGLERLVEVPS